MRHRLEHVWDELVALGIDVRTEGLTKVVPPLLAKEMLSTHEDDFDGLFWGPITATHPDDEIGMEDAPPDLALAVDGLSMLLGYLIGILGQTKAGPIVAKLTNEYVQKLNATLSESFPGMQEDVIVTGNRGITLN